MKHHKLARFVLGVLVSIVGGLVIKVWANGDSYSCKTTPIIAKAGDDYWGYVEQYCDGNKQSAADDLVDFYKLPLMPGQMIYLPSSDECQLYLLESSDGSDQVYENCN